MSGFVIGLITMVHVAGCIALMAAILLQSGKGGGLAGTFGAGSSQTLFGGRGAATFLSRATTVLAVTFFVTSLTLGLEASRSGGGSRRSLIQEEARRRGQQREGTTTPGAGGAPQPGVPQQGAAPQQGPAPGPTHGGPTSPVTGVPSPAPAEPTPTQQAPAPGNGGAQEPATGGK